MDLRYLNMRKIEQNLLMHTQFHKKGKEMKNTEDHIHIGLALLFIFSVGKWTSFYTIKGIQHYLNIGFRIWIACIHNLQAQLQQCF